jgi:hypothetical protein
MSLYYRSVFLFYKICSRRFLLDERSRRPGLQLHDMPERKIWKAASEIDDAYGEVNQALYDPV